MSYVPAIQLIWQATDVQTPATATSAPDPSLEAGKLDRDLRQTLMFVVPTVVAAILFAILLFISLRKCKAWRQMRREKRNDMTSSGIVLKTEVQSIGNQQR